MVAQVDKVLFKLSLGKAVTRLLAWALFEGRPLTTRGRFINLVVFAWYRLTQYIPLKSDIRAPIFIIGTGRSGTTVLGKLFSIHRDVMFLNEPKAIWHFAVRNEDLIGSYTNEPAEVRLDVAHATPSVASKILRIYSAGLWLSRSNQLVDKYPELIFRQKFVNKLFPKSKHIVIIRDGVDACTSVDEWSVRHQVISATGVDDWWGKNDRKWILLVNQLLDEHPDLQKLKETLLNTKNHKDRAAVEWILAMREAKKLITEEANVLQISYEHLCKDSIATLQNVLDFCGLPQDPIVFHYSRKILHESPQYAELRLMPDLVSVFQQTLTEMGYGDSVTRVVARCDGAN